MAPYIGTPTSRIDGIAKVTGAAKYAAEFNVPGGVLYGSIVPSTIAKGRIVSLDTSAAMGVEGVMTVLTHENRPRMAGRDQDYKDDVAPDGSPFRPLYDDRVMFNGQPIALVVAETSEIARFAASLVRVEYESEAHVTDVFRQRDDAVPVKATSPEGAMFAPPKPRGDAAKALAAAAVRHDAEYYVPIEHHNPMELYAATVIVEGDGKFTVYDKTQGVQNVQRYLCGVFGMKPEDVRVMSPFMGGGFGSGLRPQFEVVLAVLAARALQRSVRVVLTRPQMYALGYRPAMIQRIGARRHDRRNAGGDHARCDHRDLAIRRLLPAGDGLVRPALQVRKRELRAPARSPGSADLVRHARAERGAWRVCARMPRWTSSRSRSSSIPSNCVCGVTRTATSMKTGRSAARRCANATARAPTRSGGASATPSHARCVTAAIWSAGGWRRACGKQCRCRSPCASFSAPTDTRRWRARPPTSAPAPTPSWRRSRPTRSDCRSTASASNSATRACRSLRSKAGRGSRLRWRTKSSRPPRRSATSCCAWQSRCRIRRSPMPPPDELTLVDGQLVSKHDSARTVSIADAMRHGGVERIEQEKTTTPAEDTARAHNAHSAIFAEVKVDEQLGVIRVTRVVSAVAAGRILNTKTATSQILGGVVWGIGMALHEETLIDHRFGRIMNANIAEYHVPVNADVHDIKVIFVDEPDDSNPLGIKGLGEIGIVGVAAAVANAVYHATGTRVRNLPITLDKLHRV